MVTLSKRIAIIGPCGSGKSTLAIKLGEILNLPVHHIDCIYHKPNGAMEARETMTAKLNAIADGEKWIIDGNYKSSLEHRFRRAESVIFLNFSQEFCIESVTNRQFKPGRVGLPDYYTETKNGLDRLVNFHIKEKWPEMLQQHISPLISKHKEKIIEFATREQVDDFIKLIIKPIYKRILDDPKIKSVYSAIDKLAETSKRHWVHHGMIHVQNTIEIAKKLMAVLNIDKETQDAVLIALALHDIGKEYDDNEKGTAGKKPDHAHSSFIFSTQYLKDTDIPNKETILQAIKNHSDPDRSKDTLVGALVFACDKLDTTNKRIAELGKTIIGQRQWQYILDHEFEIKDGTLITKFIYDKGFDKDEWDGFFAKYPKWVKAPESLADILGLKYQVKFIPSTTRTLVFPDYENNIINVSSTLLHYLGKDNGITRIKALQDELTKDYKNVVFIIADGLGERILEKHLPEKSFMRQNNRQTITSVFPSTTTNATRTLATATYPAEHGWFAWAMNFGDETIELFKNTKYYTKEKLANENFVREQLPFECFFENPAKPIDIYTCDPSRVHLKNVVKNAITFDSTKEMFKKLDSLCKKDGQKFVYTYHSELDGTMHDFGASSKQAKKVVKKFNKRFEKLVRRNSNSLFIVTADHGQIDIAGFVDIYKDNDILDCLEKRFSLDPRAAAFHIKKGKDKDFRKAFAKYENDFVLYETKELVEKGVFGKFKNEDYKKFLGDFIAAGTDTNKYLVFADGKQTSGRGHEYKGHHTGLTENEMLVPLIIAPSKVT